MSEAQTVPTPEVEKDYQRAARLIREKFAALGIVATFGAPVGKVQQPERGCRYDPRPVGWAHVDFLVTFNKGPRQFTTNYRIGTGLAPWKDARVMRAVKMPHVSAFRQESAVLAIAERECLYSGRGDRYSPEMEALAAAIACAVAKWTPDPAEVLAGVCREGFEARDVTFEDWAQDFDYDPDSREAERVFNLCRDQWAKVLSIMSATDAEEFATLAGEL